MSAAAVNTIISYLFLWCFYYLLSDIRYLSDKRFRMAYILLSVLSIAILLLYYWAEKNGILDQFSMAEFIFYAALLILVYILATIRINPFIKSFMLKH